jgi:hypothetical protein
VSESDIVKVVGSNDLTIYATDLWYAGDTFDGIP